MKKHGKQLSSLLVNSIFGARLLDGATKYSIQKICDKANPWLSHVEANRHQPSVKDFARICIALNREPEELLTINFEPVHTLIKKMKEKS